MRIDIRDNFGEVKRALAQDQRNASAAAAVALTRTAKRIEEDLRKEMLRAFDKPGDRITPFTLRSLRIRAATRAKLVAHVGHLDDPDRVFKGTPPWVYLQPQIEGGPRKPKRSEIHLRNKQLMPHGAPFLVPSKHMRLDPYGNIPKGLMGQILTGVGAHPDPLIRAKSATTKRFFVPPAGHPLKPGVYQRLRPPRPPKPAAPPGRRKHRKIAGRRARRPRSDKIAAKLIFVRAPAYPKRYRFWTIGLRGVDKYFPAEFRAAYAARLAGRKM